MIPDKERHCLHLISAGGYEPQCIGERCAEWEGCILGRFEAAERLKELQKKGSLARFKEWLRL